MGRNATVMSKALDRGQATRRLASEPFGSNLLDMNIYAIINCLDLKL